MTNWLDGLDSMVMCRSSRERATVTQASTRIHAGSKIAPAKKKKIELKVQALSRCEKAQWSMHLPAQENPKQSSHRLPLGNLQVQIFLTPDTEQYSPESCAFTTGYAHELSPITAREERHLIRSDIASPLRGSLSIGSDLVISTC